MRVQGACHLQRDEAIREIRARGLTECLSDPLLRERYLQSTPIRLTGRQEEGTYPFSFFGGFNVRDYRNGRQAVPR